MAGIEVPEVLLDSHSRGFLLFPHAAALLLVDSDADIRSWPNFTDQIGQIQVGDVLTGGEDYFAVGTAIDCGLHFAFFVKVEHEFLPGDYSFQGLAQLYDFAAFDYGGLALDDFEAEGELLGVGRRGKSDADLQGGAEKDVLVVVIDLKSRLNSS